MIHSTQGSTLQHGNVQELVSNKARTRFPFARLIAWENPKKSSPGIIRKPLPSLSFQGSCRLVRSMPLRLVERGFMPAPLAAHCSQEFYSYTDLISTLLSGTYFYSVQYLHHINFCCSLLSHLFFLASNFLAYERVARRLDTTCWLVRVHGLEKQPSLDFAQIPCSHPVVFVLLRQQSSPVGGTTSSGRIASCADTSRVPVHWLLRTSWRRGGVLHCTIDGRMNWFFRRSYKNSFLSCGRLCLHHSLKCHG